MPLAPVVIGADLIVFAVLGFFTVYLLTRLFLAGALNRADDQLARSVERAQTVADLNFNDLTTDARSWLGRVIEAHKKRTELKLPDNFERESADHMALRSLRDKLIVRPKDDGTWQAGKVIELTPLGELLLKKLKIVANP